MKKIIIKKNLVAGITVLFFCSSFVSTISGFSNQSNQSITDDLFKLESQDEVIVSCRTYGLTDESIKKVEIPYSNVEIIFNKINEIANKPLSDETEQLKEEIISIAKEYNLLPKDTTLKNLQPPFLNSFNKRFSYNGVTPIIGNRGTALFCNYATTGEGSQFPVITLPRLIPILMTPIPRVFLHWSANIGITSCGSLLTGTGFIAGGMQRGSALGFWGIGFSVFIPPVMAYGFIGYALFATCTAEEIVPWPPNYAPLVSAVTPDDGAKNVAVSTSELSFQISDRNRDKMDYIVTTDPDIGSDTGFNKPGGIYSIPISGLEGTEDYTWTIQVTDGENTIDSTFSFETEQVAPTILNQYPGDGAKNVEMPLNQLSFYIEDPQGDLMDYTVETSPDIGSGSGNGVSNGEYTIDVSGVNYNTQYVWFVNVTDGTNWKHKVYDFKTRPLPGPWWNNEWLYRREIIVNYEMVEGSHDNFPVLIKLDSDDDLASKVQSDGDDIVFTDYSGNKLNHEIEFFNIESGALIAWVNAESLTSESILYLYYGNSNCSDQQNMEGTWDNNYKGVWHLNEDPGDTAPQYKDSTINNNDGIAKNMEVEDQIPGKINYAVRLNEGYGNPPQEYIDCGSDSSIRITDDITISSWVNCDTFQDDKYFYWVCTDYEGADFYNYINPGWWGGYDRIVWFRNVNEYSIYDEDSNWPRYGWHYFVVTDDTDIVRLYVDGSLRKSAESGTGSFGSSPLHIGSCEGKNNNMDAKLDETRLSDIIRNSEWILTEYNNQNNPSIFFSFGPEEIAQ